jgi:hypothetical protein
MKRQYGHSALECTPIYDGMRLTSDQLTNADEWSVLPYSFTDHDCNINPATEQNLILNQDDAQTEQERSTVLALIKQRNLIHQGIERTIEEYGTRSRAQRRIRGLNRIIAGNTIEEETRNLRRLKRHLDKMDRAAHLDASGLLELRNKPYERLIRDWHRKDLSGKTLLDMLAYHDWTRRAASEAEKAQALRERPWLETMSEQMLQLRLRRERNAWSHVVHIQNLHEMRLQLGERWAVIRDGVARWLARVAKDSLRVTLEEMLARLREIKRRLYPIYRMLGDALGRVTRAYRRMVWGDRPKDEGDEGGESGESGTEDGKSEDEKSEDGDEMTSGSKSSSDSSVGQGIRLLEL